MEGGYNPSLHLRYWKLLWLVTQHSRFSVLHLVAYNVALNNKKTIYYN